MAGAACLAILKRSRTREAPTPTNISTNSEPEMEKKATPASPATARASNVLPVPGAPMSKMPFGISRADVDEFLRILQKVDDLGELLFGFLGSGDILESHFLLGIVRQGDARLGLAEGEEPACRPRASAG